MLLITGGAGYIGNHACIELLNTGYELVVIDNFSNSKVEALTRVQEITGKKFKVYNASLLNSDILEKVFSENHIDGVMHFAGLKSVGESVKLPLDYYHNNITGTISLCMTMQKYGVKKLVFSSSATVYGVPEWVPIQEDFPLRATNPYGRTKQMTEEILADLCQSDEDWSIAALRYFNPIGSHPSGRIGEDPNGIPNNLIPYITQVAIGRIDELKVLGHDYPTQDGTGVRDYIHIEDLAKGHVKAIEKVISTNGFHTYNLGTGRGYSVLEIVNVFEKISGKKIKYSLIDRRPGDIAVCYADPSKANRELNWVAEKGIEEMCSDAWRWQLNNPNGYEEVSEPMAMGINS
ncbi:UDP-glucose 4-epimerase [Paenibacillus sp. yr247]|uniref:UDP-glucose 4-epimerase GalE n=1 Tax=Paenibacillus sp. yr247 TaxID=1761880 RepID=UPI00088560F5|nr:UDP-glucose 4-epimerase GalE [Paenibacillus sp. yr247]SDN32526.1 UDP-glucose 4-epimerase [Paenibacillus sp. yr247]